jgi:hypothetical protein
VLEFSSLQYSRFIQEIKMAKLQYLSDVMAQKRNESDAEQIRWAKSDAARAKRIAKFTPRTDMHPAIGVLISAKGVTYYAFVNGVYREGTPEHLTFLITA